MTRWWPLAVLLAVLAMLVSPRAASASSGVQPENRVGGFDLVAPTLVGLQALRGAEKRWGNSVAYGETASGYSLAAEGFSAAENAIVNEVKNVPLDQLRAAFQAGGGELSIGGRTILVDPGVPASGMTLFGENGFVLGREAFGSDAELTQTLLHETYRLSTSQAAAGVSGGLAASETNAAFSFAQRAWSAFFQ